MFITLFLTTQSEWQDYNGFATGYKNNNVPNGTSTQMLNSICLQTAYALVKIPFSTGQPVIRKKCHFPLDWY